MNGIDIQNQVEGFLGWFSRLRGTPIKPAFSEWARSKKFSPEDTASVWGAVEQEIAGHHDPEKIRVAKRGRSLDLAEIASGSEGRRIHE